MNKTVRDIVLDVRVSVPYAEPVPTFEVGKSYRTRKGDVVKIVRRLTEPTYPLQGEHHNQSWTLDGRYWVTAKRECGADLMPGAIEDEPAAAEPDVTLTDLQQIHNRLNRQAERIEDLTAERDNVKLRLTSLELLEEASVTGNRNYAHDEGARRRIGSVEKDFSHFIDNINERLDRFAIELSGKANGGFAEDHTKRLVNHGERLMNLQDRICALENYTGLNVLSAPARPGKTASELTADDFRRFASDAPKRTIKGGWVNVYPMSFGRPARIGGLCPNREVADAAADGQERIACIQIPDITEGEGL